MMEHVVAFVSSLVLTFVSSGSYYSSQMPGTPASDPQVFVKDAGAQAAVGLQGIEHGAGYRPALLSDASDAPLFSAEGAPLGITLKQWVSARGSAEIAQTSSTLQTVTVRLEGLSAYGVYSLFETHLDSQLERYAPLDGAGGSNSFIADAGGSATVSVLVSPPLSHTDAIAVFFHSDGQSHGLSPGAPGVTAHQQLVVRIP